MVTGDNPNQQLLALLFTRPVVVKLITRHVKVKFYNTTLVIVVYDRDTVLQVVHNCGHGFQNPAGGTNSNIHTINLGKNQIKTQRGITTEQLQDSYKFQGATPPSYPRRSWPAPRRTQGLRQWL